MSAETGVEVPSTRLMDRLEEVRDTARDQLRAAWELHVSRIEEQLQKDWREQISMLLDERFAEVADEIGHEVERRVGERLVTATADAVSAARSTASQELALSLNHAVRRLRFTESEDDLLTGLLDTVSGFCARAAVFRVREGSLVFHRCHGFPGDRELVLDRGFELPLKSAPAFHTAVESRDLVTASHTPGELSGTLMAALPLGREGRVTLAPVLRRGEAAAVLYVEPAAEWPVLNPVELLVTVASAVLDAAEVPAGEPAAPLVAIEGAEPAPKKISSPAWDSLSAEEQQLHLRAQRFARVQVAELRLHQSSAVKLGRVERNLYGRLKEEIDKARKVFRMDFLASCQSMVDYLHLELVRTLANDDESLLGPEYPGPLE